MMMYLLAEGVKWEPIRIYLHIDHSSYPIF